MGGVQVLGCMYASPGNFEIEGRGGGVVGSATTLINQSINQSTSRKI